MINAWKVTVRRSDVEVTYPVSPTVIVAFERNFKMGIGQAFTDQLKFEHLYWLGWKAEHSAGEVVKPFDGWLEDVDGVELDVDGLPTSESL